MRGIPTHNSAWSTCSHDDHGKHYTDQWGTVWEALHRPVRNCMRSTTQTDEEPFEKHYIGKGEGLYRKHYKGRWGTKYEKYCRNRSETIWGALPEKHYTGEELDVKHCMDRWQPCEMHCKRRWGTGYEGMHGQIRDRMRSMARIDDELY